MAQNALINVEMPLSIRQFKLPKGVDNRLHKLLDRQDCGEKLTKAESKEAEVLVDLAEMLSLLRMRSQKISRESQIS